MKKAHPTFIPWQIGGAVLPSFDWEGSPTWSSVDTVRRPDGIDFGEDDSRWRSPVEMGSLTYSGRYIDGSASAAEIKLIDSYIGSWQPLIGYKQEGECGCTACGCPTPTPGIKWLWTWAKLMRVDANGSIDSWKGQSDPYRMEFMLKEPLRQATHHWWRWGSEPPVSRLWTPREVEAQLLIDKREYFPPVIPPSCGSPVRWRYKDWRKYFGVSLDDLSVADRYSRQAWPGQLYTIRGQVVIDIDGSYDPAVYARVDFTGDSTVSNDHHGVMEFRAIQAEVYDIDTGMVWRGEEPVAKNIPFRLSPGKNRIDTGIGQITFGIIPRWLR